MHVQVAVPPTQNSYSHFMDPKHALEEKLSQLLNASSVSKDDIVEVAKTLEKLNESARTLINERSDASEVKFRICFEFIIRDFRAHLLILNDSLMAEEEMRRGAIKLLYEAVKEMENKINEVRTPNS